MNLLSKAQRRLMCGIGFDVRSEIPENIWGEKKKNEKKGYIESQW